MDTAKINESIFEKFEDEIMKTIIQEAPLGISRKLLKQYESAVVTKRDFAEVGFVTEYRVTDFSNRLEMREHVFMDDVYAKINSLEHGVVLYLLIIDGLIDCLEGTTIGPEEWPKNIKKYSILTFPPHKSEECKFNYNIWRTDQRNMEHYDVFDLEGKKMQVGAFMPKNWLGGYI